MATNYPQVTFHFTVEWQGARVGFTEVTGLKAENQVIEYREGDAKNYQVTKMPGIPKFGNITLKRGILSGDNDFNTWLGVVQRTHRPIGLSLAKKWQLSEDIQKAIEECGDYDPANRLSTGNAVRFANAVAKQQGIYVGEVNADDNDALVMVGRSLLGIDDETLTRLSGDLKEKAKEL